MAPRARAYAGENGRTPCDAGSAQRWRASLRRPRGLHGPPSPVRCIMPRCRAPTLRNAASSVVSPCAAVRRRTSAPVAPRLALARWRRWAPRASIAKAHAPGCGGEHDRLARGVQFARSASDRAASAPCSRLPSVAESCAKARRRHERAVQELHRPCIPGEPTPAAEPHTVADDPNRRAVSVRRDSARRALPRDSSTSARMMMITALVVLGGAPQRLAPSAVPRRELREQAPPKRSRRLRSPPANSAVRISIVNSQTPIRARGPRPARRAVRQASGSRLTWV